MEQSATEHSSSERQHVWSLIKDEKIAMLTTRGEDGALRARPMATVQREFDGTLWLFTKEGSPKLKEATAYPHVSLTYANRSSGAYVSVSGTAKTVADKTKIRELWSEAARLWFPQGPDEADIRLLAVDVETAEYWESPSKVSLVYNYTKARITGQPPGRDPLAENKVVKF